MRNFTIVLFFLLLGATTMMAQTVKQVNITQGFQIEGGTVPEAGTILEMDISSFGFESEQRAQKVIAGFSRNIKVNFADKTARISFTNKLWTAIGSDQERYNRMLKRLSKSILMRSEMF